MSTATGLTCRECRQTFTADQLSLHLKNLDTAFCSASGMFHNFDEPANEPQPATVEGEAPSLWEVEEQRTRKRRAEEAQERGDAQPTTPHTATPLDLTLYGNKHLNEFPFLRARIDDELWDVASIEGELDEARAWQIAETIVQRVNAFEELVAELATIRQQSRRAWLEGTKGKSREVFAEIAERANGALKLAGKGK